MNYNEEKFKLATNIKKFILESEKLSETSLDQTITIVIKLKMILQHTLFSLSC